MRFEAIEGPSAEDLAALAEAMPESPFSTAAYAAARAETGSQVVLLAMRAPDGRIAGGCTGFAQRGRLGGNLDVPCAPLAESAFWEGVVAHCRRRRLWKLMVGSFGSALGTRIPPLPGETERHARLEHVVAVADFGPSSLSSNHKRSIRKAAAAGVGFEVRNEPSLAASHLALIEASLERREGRGEDVLRARGAAQIAAFLRTGAGVLARVVRGEEVLSSMLLLLAAKGAYYHSAGSSPEGMTTGASPFLVQGVLDRLKFEGRAVLNLGGATAAEEGLHRFKRGFGGVEIPLESATADFPPRLVRLLRSLVRR